MGAGLTGLIVGLLVVGSLLGAFEGRGLLGTPFVGMSLGGGANVLKLGASVRTVGISVAKVGASVRTVGVSVIGFVEIPLVGTSLGAWVVAGLSVWNSLHEAGLAVVHVTLIPVAGDQEVPSK